MYQCESVPGDSTDVSAKVMVQAHGYKAQQYVKLLDPQAQGVMAQYVKLLWW